MARRGVRDLVTPLVRVFNAKVSCRLWLSKKLARNGIRDVDSPFQGVTDCRDEISYEVTLRDVSGGTGKKCSGNKVFVFVKR
jgi:hypothetical protein